LIVIYGPGSEGMGRDIAEILGVEGAAVGHRLFPDGESYLRLPLDVEGSDVVLVHSTGPPQDRRLVQLLLVLDGLRESGAGEVTVVAPYLAYARQDRRRLPGEVVSVGAVIRLLLGLGVSRLVTVNVHNSDVFGGSRLGLVDLSAVPLLARRLRDEGLGGAFSLSLGKKPVDVEHAKEAASVLGGGWGRVETFRDPVTGEVSLGEAEVDVRGRRAVIFDDAITSGGTHIKAAGLLRGAGAEEVHLACVHSLIPEEGLEGVLEAVDGFVCTDTVPGRFSVVRVAPLIAGALKEF